MSSKQAPALDQKAIFYMCLLALQFGMQPTLTRKYTADGICRSTVILMQEGLKFFFAFFMLNVSGGFKSALAGKHIVKVVVCF
jgi:UDP-sugar transporter A1/2/3